MKFKKGDTIIVTIGKDKGRKGKIEQVIPKESTVIVPGINIFKRHLKKRDERQQGGIVEVARALDTAKIALVCPKCGKQTRIGYEKDGKINVRICNKCKARI